MTAFSDNAVIDLRANFIRSFDDNTLLLYSIEKFDEYERFVNKYWKGFDIESNLIECDCMAQKKICWRKTNIQYDTDKDKLTIIKTIREHMGIIKINCNLAMRINLVCSSTIFKG